MSGKKNLVTDSAESTKSDSSVCSANNAEKAGGENRVAPGARFVLGQVYEMQDVDGAVYRYDVTEGIRIARMRGEVLDFCPRDFGITAEHIRARYPDIDEAYAHTTDLSRPLLFVLHPKPEEATAILIDGWHRLFRAVTEGGETLPAWALTREEAEQIRLPPGEIPEETVGDGEGKTVASAPWRFAPGRLCVTPGAGAALVLNPANSAARFLSRHLTGDWGDLCPDDRTGNERALKEGTRILSSYRLRTGEEIWIITEADRSATTILLPEEY
ncbi:MAG: hypothetical protein V4671_15485 [Armatimonadota bacterium]